MFMMNYFDGTLTPSMMMEFRIGVEMCVHEAEIFVFRYVFIEMMLARISLRDGTGAFIVKEIRRRANLESLILMVTSMTGGLVTYDDLRIKVHLPVVEAAMNFNSTLGDPLRDFAVQHPTANYTFSAKSLIQYLSSFEIDLSAPDFNVSELFAGAAAHYSRWDISESKLQIVEIAVNDGTTKEFMSAVMTELIQNSIDASRSTTWTDSRHRKIDIEIGADGVAVRDYVGMTPNQLIPLMIPFLSSKNFNDSNVTGEMGTGFFNVY